MEDKRFRAAFVAMAPDADPAKHNSLIETSTYWLTTVLVRNEAEAVELCRNLVREKNIHSFLLCPGFTNRGVARVQEAVGANVAVNVSRGDGPSGEIAKQHMKEAGFGRPSGSHS